MAKKKEEIKEKPKEILELEHLLKLNLYETKPELSITGTMIGRCYSLNSDGKVIALALDRSKINDAMFIGNFVDLIYLSLTGNEISDTKFLLPLIKLQYLFSGRNKISKLTDIDKLTNLAALAVWENPIKDFGKIENLTNLQGLYLQQTNLKSINFARNLNKLVYFYADENKIERIESLQNLNSLNELRLSNNLIKCIPKELAVKFQWFGDSTQVLDISSNPLSFPPFSVIELGSESTQNYYQNVEQFGHQPLSEGRIIFVGGGESGKSSIIEKMLHNTFVEGKPQTDGIAIKDWSLKHPIDNRELTFHIWDFGGQEIQHAVHKFFFTEGCLYVLVLNNRKEDDPEYWLQQIESLGGSAPVVIVFNKYDQNPIEIVDRKFLKEKYPNIVGFYNTSCKTDVCIEELKNVLEKKATELRTVDEEFPNNWFSIKKAIEQRTSGSQHYLSYETYKEICRQNQTDSEATQKLLLKYFNTIGAVTWFGDDAYLNLFHVLNPAWITEGVYKIITAKKTAKLFGQIHINDFKELLQPKNDKDYTYDEKHYAYILSMMKRFDLCYTPDDKNLLIPSAFGKEPKVEYREFIGAGIITYILQFKDYMPIALIHRFIAKRLPDAYDSNYWYSGIVIKDSQSDTLTMVQADKEAKRIYVRIKGDIQLGVWEDIRREMGRIASSYAKIPYSELVALDEKVEATVNYEDIVSHLTAQKPLYFHPRLKKDYNVGYLLGLFEKKEDTLDKFKTGEISIGDREANKIDKIPPFAITILNNNSPTVNTQVNTQVNIDIDLTLVNNISSIVKGDADYLIEQLGDSNKALTETLKKVMQFADDAKKAQNSGDVKEKGWGRKLKSVLETLGSAGEQLKNIQDGKEALGSILHGLKDLAVNFHLKDIADLIMNLPGSV